MRRGMTLEFKVTQQEITRLDSQKVYEKTKGYLYAHFVFSDDWEGYLKTVKFSNLLDNSYIGVTLASDNTCMVPYTLILYPGVTFCIEGTKDGDIITTNDFVFDVDESNSSNIPQDQPIYEIESKTLDYEKDGITATLNVKNEVLEEVDNTLEITSEDITIEDDKIVFNSDVANEIMSMNKRLKVDASIVDPDLKFTYIGLFTPRAIAEYPSIPTYTIYEYSTTNLLIDECRTTYIEFLWDKTTEKLYVDANNPTFEENHITGFRSDNTDGNINLTYDVEMYTPILNVLHINDFNIISINKDVPSLEFNANENNELESIAFKQDGSTADFAYTIPKGAKHYVVNELPTTDIDTTGNYYVMTESEDARGYLSTDIHNLSTTEFPVRMGGESRSNAVVNTTNYTMLSSASTSVGEYRGSLAIRFNIPCTVTVTLNPRPSSSSGPGRFGFMNLYKNNYNNHIMLTSAGEVGTHTLTFAKDEILCIDCSGFTNQFYYKLAIQPYTIDGKIPLSTNVDEYINYENMWFKNGGGSEVIANPTLSGNEETLEGAEIDGIKYKVGGGGKLYRHSIKVANINRNSYCYLTLDTSTNTPFTTSTLFNYLISVYGNQSNRFNVALSDDGTIPMSAWVTTESVSTYGYSISSSQKYTYSFFYVVSDTVTEV